MKDFITFVKKYSTRDFIYLLSRISIEIYKNQLNHDDDEMNCCMKFPLDIMEFGFIPKQVPVMLSAWDIQDMAYLSIRHSNDFRNGNLSSQDVGTIVALTVMIGVLLAKVKVVLKRLENIKEQTGAESENKQQVKNGYDDGYLKIDYMNKLVYINREEKKLTSMEFRLLVYLADNANRLVTKEELFDNVWNDKFTGDGTLNVHIRKIREAIEADPRNPKYIVTVWKEGYKFVTV